MNDSDDNDKAAARLANLTAASEKAKAEIEARQAAYAGQAGEYGTAMQAFGVGNGASLQAQFGTAAQAQTYQGLSSTTYAGSPFSWHPVQYAYHATAVTVVHHFTGAPKNEVKRLGCGQVLVSETAGKGFRLVGHPAATEIDDVTCLGCLRALIKK